jgi:hypothetical protein
MKLYTEEQVIAGFIVFGGVTEDIAKKVVELITSIELPTDEQIYSEAEGHSTFSPSYIEGARYVINYIKNQQK